MECYEMEICHKLITLDVTITRASTTSSGANSDDRGLAHDIIYFTVSPTFEPQVRASQPSSHHQSRTNRNTCRPSLIINPNMRLAAVESRWELQATSSMTHVDLYTRPERTLNCISSPNWIVSFPIRYLICLALSSRRDIDN